MTYYTDSAYTANQETPAGHCHEVFTENSIDVRDFPKHDEYLLLQKSRRLWPEKESLQSEYKKAKGDNKKAIKLIMNTHRYMYFPAIDNSTMTAFMAHSIKSIGYVGIFCFFLMIFFIAAKSEPKAIYIYFSSSRYNWSDYWKVIRNVLCAKLRK